MRETRANNIYTGDKGKDRIVEAFIGEYASGKSEVAINRALELYSLGRQVKLVDLDLVEPFYTLRPIKNRLEEKGLEVVALETAGIVGLGETGSLFRPEMKWALRNGGDVVFDVGYGVGGATALNMVEGVSEEQALKKIVVVNVARPITGSIEDIIEFVQSLGEVDGLINNPHLGMKTDIEIIRQGAEMVTEAANQLGLPVVATTVARDFAHLVGDRDHRDNPIKIIDLFMHNAYW